MDLLKRRKVIKNCQIFNIKFDNHYKSQLVVKEFSQAKEIDFDELFSLVVCYEILCLFLAVAILEDWNIYSVNIKTAYFYNVGLSWQQTITKLILVLEFKQCKFNTNVYYFIDEETRELVIIIGTKADLFFLKESDTDNSISKLILSNNQLYNLHSFAWESVYLGKISLLKIACMKQKMILPCIWYIKQ